MDAPHAADRRRAWGLGAVVVVLWGLSFAATRIAVVEVGPWTLAFLRFVIALVVLWPIVRRGLRRTAPAGFADHRDLFLAGFFGVTLAFVLENTGLAHTTAAHGSLIVATAPLATALTEGILVRRAPAARTLLGFALALGGVTLIVGGDTGGEATVLGDGLMLSTVAIWVIYGFVVHRVSRRHPVGWVTHLSIVWGVVTLVPFAAFETIRDGWRAPSPLAWGCVAFLGVFCSGLAYLWWNRCLQVLGATTTNSLIYAIPLVAVAGGIVLLGEPLSVTVLGGGALVIGGLLVAHTRARRAPGGVAGGS